MLPVQSLRSGRFHNCRLRQISLAPIPIVPFRALGALWFVLWRPSLVSPFTLSTAVLQVRIQM